MRAGDAMPVGDGARTVAFIEVRKLVKFGFAPTLIYEILREEGVRGEGLFFDSLTQEIITALNHSAQV
ncbi:hypothetical protein [Acidocella sp.]|uniref:hypothetical protein n=1 Tax=Acidocella sp. TaxID=50710 RepID=UPI00184EE741|nr:hypothetical protein [Acidocella sp.]NNM57075.1 hypothetical protein [Acidocella sp.]